MRYCSSFTVHIHKYCSPWGVAAPPRVQERLWLASDDNSIGTLASLLGDKHSSCTNGSNLS